MACVVTVERRGSAPEVWEARVVVDDRPGIAAAFHYERRGRGVILTEVALRRGGGGSLVAADLRRRYPLASWEKAARTAVLEESGSGVPLLRVTGERAVERLSRDMQVAFEYRDNVKKGLRDPVAEIARRHGVKPSTARGWVYRCRRRGLLGAARGRTSGET